MKFVKNKYRCPNLGDYKNNQQNTAKIALETLEQLASDILTLNPVQTKQVLYGGTSGNIVQNSKFYYDSTSALYIDNGLMITGPNPNCKVNIENFGAGTRIYPNRTQYPNNYTEIGNTITKWTVPSNTDAILYNLTGGYYQYKGNLQVFPTDGGYGGYFSVQGNNGSTVSITPNGIPTSGINLSTGLTYSINGEPHYHFPYAGCVVDPVYTDNLNGTITMATQDVALFMTSGGDKQAFKYTVSGNTFTPTDNATSYIVASYNSGSPIMFMTSDVNIIDETTTIPVLTIYRIGTRLDIISWDSLSRALPNKLHQSIVKTQRYRREYGLLLSEFGTRNVAITLGRVWVGAHNIILTVYNSVTNPMYYFMRTSGTWVNSTSAQYNNTEYSDGTNTQTLSNNRYAVNWIYRGVEDEPHTYMVLGNGNYSLNDANTSQPPNNLPAAITSHAILVGRIIVEKGASVATRIDSAFDITFAGSTSNMSHTDLINRNSLDQHTFAAISTGGIGTIPFGNTSANTVDVNFTYTSGSGISINKAVGNLTPALSVSGGGGGGLVGVLQYNDVSVKSGFTVRANGTNQNFEVHNINTSGVENATAGFSVNYNNTGVNIPTSATYNINGIPHTHTLSALEGVQPIFNGLNIPSLFTTVYTSASKQFTVNYGAGAAVYCSGIKYPKSGSETITHTSASGSWFLYYNNSGVLSISQTPWDILTTSQLSLLYYNNSTGKYLQFEERHPAQDGMDVAEHLYLHNVNGTRYISGAALSGYTLNTAGAAALSYAIGSGVFYDEDIVHTPAQLNDGGPYRVMYRSGTDASGLWDWSDTSVTGILDNGTDIVYNQLVTSAWQLTPLTANNKWTNYYCCFFPSIETSGTMAAKQQYVIIMGQTIYNSLAEAQADDPAISISWGTFPSKEFYIFARCSYERSNGKTPSNAVLSGVSYPSVNGVTVTAGNPTTHNALSGRSDPNSHPLVSITSDTTGGIPYGATTGLTQSSAFTYISSASKVNIVGPLALSPTTTPTNITSASDVNMYVKGGKLIVQYNDSGTVRYRYMDLVGTSAIWVHTTVAP